jgi:hypothetical protein
MVGDFNATIFDIVSGLGHDPQLRRLEAEEAQKCIILDALPRGNFAPEKHTVAMPNFDYKADPSAYYRTKRDGAVPKAMAMLLEKISQRITKLRRKGDLPESYTRRAPDDTNPGWPFWRSSKEAHVASSALAQSCRNMEELREKGRKICIAETGVDVPLCLTRFVRRQENRKSLIEYAFGGTGLRAVSLAWNMPRVRPVNGAPRCLNEAARRGARAALRALKSLFPGMDFHSLEELGDMMKRSKVEWEGDLERFDANCSYEIIELVSSWSSKWTAAAGGSEWEVAMATPSMLEVLKIGVLSPSSIRLGGAAIGNQTGLASGVIITSVMSNVVTASVLVEAYAAYHEITLEKAFEKFECPTATYPEEGPKLYWYGDDIAGADEGLSLAVNETFRQYGHNLEILSGRTLLRSVDGHLVCARTMWRSIQWERTKSVVVLRVAVGARGVGLLGHPNFEQAWRFITRCYRRVGIELHGDPLQEFKNGAKELTDFQASQLSKEYGHSPQWQTLVEGLSPELRSRLVDPGHVIPLWSNQQDATQSLNQLLRHVDLHF